MKLSESFEEISLNIYATKSAYDVLLWFKNKPKTYRVVYDKNLNTHFIGYALENTHQNLLESAFKSGFYHQISSLKQLNSYIYENLFKQSNLLFFIFEDTDLEIVDIENADEGYTYKYVYPYGVIYAYEKTPLENFDFYSIIEDNVYILNHLITPSTEKSIQNKIKSLI